MRTKIERLSGFAKLSYGIPLTVAFLALVAAPFDPLLAILFGLHGGLAWLGLLLSFPAFVAGVVSLGIVKERSQGICTWQDIVLLSIGYPVVTILCSYALTLFLNPPFKNTVGNLLPWFYFPISLLFGELDIRI